MQAILVDNANDSGTDSLRQALATATSNGVGIDDVLFDPAVFNVGRTVLLASTLQADSGVNIFGPGADLTLSGNESVRVFNEGTLLLDRVTVSGNAANGFGIAGGGVSSTGTLTLRNSTVSGNSASTGGIGAAGDVFVQDGSAQIEASTITQNTVTGTAASRISGLLVLAGTASLQSTTVAGNVGNTTNADVAGAFTASRFNLIGNVGTATGFTRNGNQTGTAATPLNPQLAPLANNEGRLPTHAMAANKARSSSNTSVSTRSLQLGHQSSRFRLSLCLRHDARSYSLSPACRRSRSIERDQRMTLRHIARPCLPLAAMPRAPCCARHRQTTLAGRFAAKGILQQSPRFRSRACRSPESPTILP
ncbi:MAG: hypothetical protein MUE46_15635 [Xanthomonadales bacterium]|jgi:hypothetical protein|nr:hypothetical protein [Xanthomonadales bacterium]